MLTERAVTAAARVAALDERLRQLEQRIERIGAGDRSSAEDVRDARTHATTQRARALEAEAALGRLRKTLELACTPTGDPIYPPRTHRDPSSPDAGMSRPGGSGAARSNQYWRAVADQSRRLGWRSWSEALCLSAASALPSVNGVAISVFTDRLPCPMASTDAQIGRLEEAQQILGEGPALAAQSCGAPVVASVDDSTDAIWLGWSKSARQSGVCSVWSFPHYWRDIGRATVTFYRGTRATTSYERDEASVLSSLAGRALKTDLDRDTLSGLGAMHTLHVATGVLAERYGITIADALATLRAHAFAADLGLAEIAAAIIDEDLRLE